MYSSPLVEKYRPNKLNNTFIVQNNKCFFKTILKNNIFVGPSVVFTNDKYPDAMHWDDTLKLKTLFNDSVSIGANSTILPGIEIGKGTLIGAGSVVTKSFDDNLVIYGNPAIIIKKR